MILKLGTDRDVDVKIVGHYVRCLECGIKVWTRGEWLCPACAEKLDVTEEARS